MKVILMVGGMLLAVGINSSLLILLLLARLLIVVN